MRDKIIKAKRVSKILSIGGISKEDLIEYLLIREMLEIGVKEKKPFNDLTKEAKNVILIKLDKTIKTLKS